MDPEPVLERLLESDVLDGGEELGYTDPFLKKREQWESALSPDDQDGHSRIDTAVDSAPMRDRMQSVAAYDSSFAALYLSISEFVADTTDVSLVPAAVVLDSLENRPSPTSGSPDGFLPISGHSIRTYSVMYEQAIVFVWREDCPTCELVREDLENIFADGSQEIALFSVYGPSCPELLSGEYDVGGGPTTLFFRDGTIDSRTVGALQPGILEREVEVLRGTA